ncbi:MAG: 50S ribosomal protein L6 [Gammaproteobacteria bacterium]|jgi:large subunit ribosomal protein L6|nr:50S ribosomal protein L6 [Gammaproteobacteria bacterium]MBU13689.1 50S ribosomal protein L6 [Gammaproteobacteria bacterium]|tara:strand:- start:57 stop:590 length:534 start_codon:yes stop_codon:yes gene_type:complete
MSRIANAPVAIPKGVETTLSDTAISVKGSKGNLILDLHELVGVSQEGEELKVAAKNQTRQAGALAGTFRSLINNMVVGVSEGFQKKLELQGVGYRAKAQGKSLNLTLGYSHPIDYSLPEGVTAETPSQTEIVITGADKQLVGQVAAEIREFRPPEPYKGKGVRYADEHVYRKEAKKK